MSRPFARAASGPRPLERFELPHNVAGGHSAALPLGLVVHPRLRYRRLGALLELCSRNGTLVRVVRTEHVKELPAALETLLEREGVRALGVLGGDGTVHHTLNALLGHCGVGHEALPVPLVLLRGGSMNMLGRALRVGGEPLALLEGLLLGTRAPRAAEAPLLRVRSARWGDRYGFIFGSSLTARCIELHEGRFGGGYAGLARFMSSVVAGAALGTRFWKEHRRLLEPAAGPALVDGMPLACLAAAATTVPVELLGGLLRGLDAPQGGAGSLRVRVLGPLSAAAVLTRLPHLALGRAAEGISDFPAARELRLEGDFSLEGEVYAAGEADGCQGADPGALEVTAPGTRVRFLLP
jgi:hypothetical protein